MNYAKEYADKVILTAQDNASDDPTVIGQEMAGYLAGSEKCKEVLIIADRKLAIQRALAESLPGEVIYIAGRGNRQALCVSATASLYFTDKEAVEEALSALKW
jgi:UDP-N-acetylmuramyl tripeptide synthase